MQFVNFFTNVVGSVLRGHQFFASLNERGERKVVELKRKEKEKE
jgi:hypothetical protein